MKVTRQYFDVISDNDENYFSMLSGVIESVDELSSLHITKQKESYQFRLCPSLPLYNDSLIKTLTEFHTMLQIRLNISKSIKTTGTIFFTISLA